MNQYEYLKELRRCLSILDRVEEDRVIEYYAELIGDKVGIPEEEVLSQLGTPRELADKILAETQEYGEEPKHIKEPEKLSVGRIVGFSILIPFVITALAILYSVAVSFVAASVGMQLGGVLTIIGSFIVMFTSIGAGICQLGVAIFVSALGLFAAYGSWKFILLCIKITQKIFKAYVRTYTKEA
mgnify:CR=1 FL=1